MSGAKVRNMEEFAALAGISRPTVSKYFNDPASVRQTTRDRIESALERYDYRPNIFAINQNRKLTKNVGIVVPYLADPFFAEMARILEQLCLDAGFQPTLFSAYGVPAQEVAILETLRSLKPAGVLFAPLGRASDRGAVASFCADVPTVLFDSNIEGLGEAFIGSDNFSFVQETVEYLCRTGSPPVLFEMRTPANPNANKRRLAYLEVMRRQGLEPKVIGIEGTGWGFEEIGHRGGLQLLSEGPLPSDTILCSNDRLAIGLLAACFEKGLTVGRNKGADLRIASMDDHPFSRFTCPALTTAAHDYKSVSEGAVSTLIDLIEAGGRFETRTETLFAARLIMRESA